jgi:hypothetical protein
MPSAIGTAAVTVTTPAPPPPPPPPTVIVKVTPQTTALHLGQSQQFTATVPNTTNQSVVWKVNGVIGGSSKFGTITTKGLYKTPSSVPSPATVTITAVSVANSSDSASASLTLRR